VLLQVSLFQCVSSLRSADRLRVDPQKIFFQHGDDVIFAESFSDQCSGEFMYVFLTPEKVIRKILFILTWKTIISFARKLKMFAGDTAVSQTVLSCLSRWAIDSMSNDDCNRRQVRYYHPFATSALFSVKREVQK
jgi:hypothetical protein